MAVPTLKVEISFVSDPLATSPTWVDVTSYVREDSVRISRGRNDPWSPYKPGRASFQLDNRTRRFDPQYSTGPYYGNLKPKRQVRITATYSAVDYRMFTGWTSSFPQNYRAAGKDAYVDIVCYDALEWLSGVRMSSDPMVDFLTDGSYGTLYWFRQSSGNLWTQTGSTSFGCTRVGPAQTPVDTLAPGLKSTPVVLGGQNYYLTPYPLSTVGSTFTVAFWLRTNSVNGKITDHYDASTDVRYTLSTDLSGCLVYRSGTTSNYKTVTTTASISDGQTHFVVLHFDNAGGASFYIDGVAATSTTASTGSGYTFTDFWMSYIGIGYNGSNPFVGAFQDFATFGVNVGGDNDVTATDVLGMYNVGIGIVPETAETRMGRYLDDIAWPAAWRDISTNTRATLGTLIYNNQSALTALRELELSEQGKVFAAKDGKVTLLARYAHQEVTRNSTVQATFSDDGADFQYMTFGWVQDDTNIRNDITVQSSNFESRSQDSTSQTTYGRRSETVNTALSSYEQCRDMAAGLVYWWKDAAVRVEPFEVKPVTTGWETLLGLELGDKIQAEITPMATGSQAVFPLLVNQIEWRISQKYWRLTLGGEPVPTSFFLLGTSSLGGADLLGF